MMPLSLDALANLEAAAQQFDGLDDEGALLLAAQLLEMDIGALRRAFEVSRIETISDGNVHTLIVREGVTVISTTG